jgi:hypothetical protein
MLAGIHLYQQLLGLRAHDVLRQRVGDGWWIGRAPYGYQRHPHQITTSASRPATRYRLTVDPTRAPTVPVIFDWTLRHGLTARQVAGRLATDPQRHPLPTDGISTQPWPWTPDVVRGILTNPTYLGYSVWARTFRGRRRGPNEWVWSGQPTHPALIKPAVFWAVHSRLHPNPDHTAEPDIADPDAAHPAIAA